MSVGRGGLDGKRLKEVAGLRRRLLYVISTHNQVEAVGSEVTRLRAGVDFSPKDHQLVVRHLMT